MAKPTKRGKRPHKRGGDDNASRNARSSRGFRKGVDEREEARNDVSWYSRNPSLLVAAASIPYPNRPGMTIRDVATTNVYSTPGKLLTTTIPGILTLDWFPTLGSSLSSLDPASVAGKEFYGRVRAAYSGQLDADAPDYIVYVAALDSIFAYIGWLKRVYRAISTYSIENFMVPDALLQAMGFSTNEIQQLRGDKTRLWQYINELILKSRKFKCPAVMDLFNRHYWMSDNVYADAPSPKAQLYVFNMAGVFKAAQVAEASTGDMVWGLQTTVLPTYTTITGNIVDALYDFGQSLIAALDEWDDAYTISGYLMRAFESVPSFSVAELQQGEIITPQFVPEVLTQIENSRTLYAPTRYTDANLVSLASQLVVTQRVSDNAVISKLEATIAFTATGDSVTPDLYYKELCDIRPMLSSRNDSPTVADTVIASRLHSYTKAAPTTTANSYKLEITCGTEIPIRWRLVTSDDDGVISSDVVRPWITVDSASSIGGSGNTRFTSAGIVAALSMEQFDWHPFLVAVCSNGSGRP